MSEFEVTSSSEPALQVTNADQVQILRVEADGTVSTIDWEAIEIEANKFREGEFTQVSALCKALVAVRDFPKKNPGE